MKVEERAFNLLDCNFQGFLNFSLSFTSPTIIGIGTDHIVLHLLGPPFCLFNG